MPDEARIQQAARFLFEEHRARRPFRPLPEAIAPRNVREAYTMQEAFHTLSVPARGPIAGYKVALTTPVMQQLVGFSEP